jgi:hypothetical protein
MDDPAPPAPAGATLDCANCGTARAGPWCHVCGQHAEATHRSVRRLALEAFTHLANTDGKTLRTLRQLATHPATLTRRYLAGHRVSQVAPINLFLVILVLFLFTTEQTPFVVVDPPTAASLAAIPHALRWIIPLIGPLRQHAAGFNRNLNESAELFGLLTVPIAAMLLWALFAVPARGIRLYDHLIFALHSLSFQFIILGIIGILPDSAGLLTLPLFALMAAHLFFHMRGTYRRGALPTLARMALLAAGTLVCGIILFTLWMTLAYAALWI